jgi:AraC-like DNA-binding protein
MEKYPILKLIGREWIKKEKKYFSASHPFWELIYIVEGNGIFKIENKELTLEEGKVILIRPNIIHSSEPRKNGYLVYCLFIDYPNWGILKKKGKSIDFICQERVIFHSLLSSLLKYYTLSENKNIIKFLLNSLIEMLKFEIFLQSEKVLHNNKNRKKIFLAEKIRCMIEENYAEQIKFSDIAKKLGLSYSRVAHIFKEIYGISMKNYLIQYRLNMAKYYLTSQPQLPIKTIIRKVGFNNTNYFYVQFKKFFGLSPSLFRLSFSVAEELKK